MYSLCYYVSTEPTDECIAGLDSIFFFLLCLFYGVIAHKQEGKIEQIGEPMGYFYFGVVTMVVAVFHRLTLFQIKFPNFHFLFFFDSSSCQMLSKSG